jgi:transcriptional regulator with PAS, ATPase and Fis domain
VGESGVEKKVFQKFTFSHRKHGKYIAVNCGAIPEGTIDSELLGMRKALYRTTGTREGYFEVANGGTIFLDEVGELPLTTQVRLLRVLENGELFIFFTSSKRPMYELSQPLTSIYLMLSKRRIQRRSVLPSEYR